MTVISGIYPAFGVQGKHVSRPIFPSRGASNNLLPGNPVNVSFHFRRFFGAGARNHA